MQAGVSDAPVGGVEAAPPPAAARPGSLTWARRAIGSRARRGVAQALVLRVGGVATAFLLHAVIARRTGAEGYGVFAYTMAITGLLAIVAALGWPSVTTRFTAQFAARHEWGLLKGALIRAHQIPLLGAVVTSAMLAAFAAVGPAGPMVRQSLWFSAVLLPLVAIVGIQRRAQQGFQNVIASKVPDELLLPSFAIVGVLVLGADGASGILWIYTAAAGIVVAVGSVWLRLSLPRSAAVAVPEYRTRIWMVTALPMLLGAVSQLAMNKTDVLMLGWMSGMDSVGQYGAAARLAVLTTFVLGAVNTMAAPMLAAAYHTGDERQFRRIVRRAMGAATAGAMPVCAGLLIWPELLLGLFGAEFREAALLLRILCLGQLINAMTGPVGFALLMSGRERAFARTLFIVGVLNVIANALVIPRYGAVGAAVVTMFCVAALNSWQFVLVRRIRVFGGAVPFERGGR